MHHYGIRWQWVMAALLTAIIGHPAAQANEDAIIVEQAYVIPDAVGASAYLVLNNRSAKEVTLTAVSSPIAANVRIVRSDGTELVGGATIPIHAELFMHPAGTRIDLRGIQTPLAEGTRIPLSLTLSDGLKANVDGLVLSPASILPNVHDAKH